MTAPRDDRVASLFDEACRLSADARCRFLDSVCAHDPAMRGLLESLLLATGAGPASDHIATRPSRPSTSPPLPGLRADDPIQLGPYHLLSVLGSGSFGVVYLGERRDPILHRVAVKLLMHGVHHAEIVARFQQERQHLALMDHPAIAKIFDAGAAPDGRPYFVMEYVKGDPITSYCDALHLGLRERLSLFLAVCDGVQHAHSMGVIHRDLKPSNVLVALPPGSDDLAGGGTRAALGRPMIIDFGISKAIHSTAVTHDTRKGETVGTPAYMSPEQAAGQTVDPRADVYALGIMLYELLAGVLPFDPSQHAGGFPAFLKHVAETDAARPSDRLPRIGNGLDAIASSRDSTPTALLRALRHDLEWIPLKAIEKDRARRYQSAGALAADIDRYLNNIPIDARPPSVTYRAGKFARRNRILLSGVALATVALLAGSAASAYSYLEARRGELIAAQKAAESKATLALLLGILRGADPVAAKQRHDALRAPLDLMVRSLDGPAYATRPLEAVNARLQVAKDYLDLNLPDIALEQVETAIELMKSIGVGDGDASQQFRTSMDHALGFRGTVLARLDRYDEAEDQLRSVIAQERSSGSPQDELLLQHLSRLAIIRDSRGDRPEALAMLQQVIDDCDRRSDSLLLIETNARAARAAIIANDGRLPDAVAEARGAVDCIRLVSEPTIETDTKLINAQLVLGGLLRQSGDSAQALARLADAHRLAQARLDPDLPLALEVALALAKVHLDCDELAPAAALAQDTAGRLLRIDPSLSSRFLPSAMEVLTVTLEESNPEAAIDFYTEQIRRREQAPGRHPLEATGALLGIARAELALGDFPAAVEKARQVYEIRRAVPGLDPDSMLMVSASTVYGAALSAAGNLDAADSLLRNAAAAADRTTQPLRLRKLIAKALADHCDRLGRSAEARAWRSKLKELNRAHANSASASVPSPRPH